MEQDYNFWRDLLDTYQSLTPWVQALWLVGPLGFVLALLKLPKPARKAAAATAAATAVRAPPTSAAPPADRLSNEDDLMVEEIDLLRLSQWREDQRNV